MADLVDCSGIDNNVIGAVCNEFATAGTFGQVVLLNYRDIDRENSQFTDGDTTKEELSLIVLKSGHGYTFDSLDNSNVGAVSLNKGTYRNQIQQDVTMRIFSKNPDAKHFVNSLKEARVVAIVHNKERGSEGQSEYEVYGWDAGLELNTLTGTTEMADGVVYEITIGSGTVAQENSLPKDLWAGNLADTEALIQSLITP